MLKNDYLLVAVTSKSFLLANLVSCKSWLDLLIGTGLSIFWCIGTMCTQSKVLRIFTVLECTHPFNTEVVLFICGKIFAHVVGLFWIYYFSCQTTFLRFDMDVVAKFLVICLCKNPWAKLWAAELSGVFQSFLNSWAMLTGLKSWFS